MERLAASGAASAAPGPAPNAQRGPSHHSPAKQSFVASMILTPTTGSEERTALILGDAPSAKKPSTCQLALRSMLKQCTSRGIGSSALSAGM